MDNIFKRGLMELQAADASVMHITTRGQRAIRMHTYREKMQASMDQWAENPTAGCLLCARQFATTDRHVPEIFVFIHGAERNDQPWLVAPVCDDCAIDVEDAELDHRVAEALGVRTNTSKRRTAEWPRF